MKQQQPQLPITIKRKAYICAELNDASLWKTAAGNVNRVVEEFRGEITDSGYLFERFTITAVFPHRRFKALEQAVKTALADLPVREVAIWPTDPFNLRRSRAA